MLVKYAHASLHGSVCPYVDADKCIHLWYGFTTAYTSPSRLISLSCACPSWRLLRIFSYFPNLSGRIRLPLIETKHHSLQELCSPGLGVPSRQPEIRGEGTEQTIVTHCLNVVQSLPAMPNIQVGNSQNAMRGDEAIE